MTSYSTILTTAGEGWIIDTIDAAADEPKYIHWGTGTTEAAKEDTGMETARGESRVEGTASQPSPSIYQVVGTLTCAGSGATITEAGLFTAATDGTCVIHANHAGVALEVGDKIEYTITLEIT